MLTLVLLPGMDGTGELFDPLLKELREQVDVQVIRYPATLAGYAKLTDFVRMDLPFENDYVLLGESFAGPISVRLAAENNPKLKGLILCCSFISNPRSEMNPFEPFLPIVPIKLASTKIMISAVLGKFSNLTLCKSIQNAIQSIPVNIIRSRISAVMSVNVSDEFEKVTVPILYLRATHDWFVPNRISIDLTRRNSKVRIADIEGPHFLLQANPIVAANEIRSFLTEIQNAN
ncbi:alpha/beta fold hydrolase [Solimicrobium silvestre]|uniref:Alpha/beta hydrolase family n=1 Tax=Solimicrobium silvestre TaxID=2099400 RepID=A0A2S9GYG4_9BURK|nr:alpha/beta hydrolase [Solimicrobium silvestre]PRC92748.1 Alpha/beta hydrolase family [Solimicrobium silvestre]